MEFAVKGYDIVGYTFNTEIYCPGDIRRMFGTPDQSAELSTEEVLDIAAIAHGIDRSSERNFDSNEFPKVIFASMVDGPELCGACHADLIS